MQDVFKISRTLLVVLLGTAAHFLVVQPFPGRHCWNDHGQPGRAAITRKAHLGWR